MAAPAGCLLLQQGAEARLFVTDFLGKPCLVKQRFKKHYRHPDLDSSLTSRRMKAEVRAMTKCRAFGVHTPALYFVDLMTHSIYMEYIRNAVTAKEFIYRFAKDSEPCMIDRLAAEMGKLLAKLHSNDMIHGDLTTSNILVRVPYDADLQLVLIDFGLSYMASSAEDKGVDLYVLERAFLSTHPNTESTFQKILDSYCQHAEKGSSETMAKLDEVRLRGRKRTMVG